MVNKYTIHKIEGIIEAWHHGVITATNALARIIKLIEREQ